MRVYFLADRLCSLFIGGVFLGSVDGFERRTEIDPQDGVFCEIAPHSPFLPVRFRFDDAFLFAPPPGVSLYFTENAVAVYASEFLRADASMRILWQKKFGEAKLTLTVQGKVQLHLETEFGYFPVSLPDPFEACEASRCGEHFLLQAEGEFVLLSRKGEILMRADGHAEEKDGVLTADVPLRDSMGHSALCTWEDGKLTACTLRAAREPTEATYALALFESALIGADVLPFLHPSLAAKAGTLRDFLGDFRSVVLTGEQDRVGLVYARRERVYEVRYFRVTVADGKIANIREE